MAFFLTNDALVKMASAQIGIFQSLFVRGALASMVLSFMAWRMGAFRLRPGWRHPTVLWRAGIDAIASMVYMAGLVQLPLANATAINLATPLILIIADTHW
jgi:drug/metabolite transporter (DMT)-like permease